MCRPRQRVEAGRAHAKFTLSLGCSSMQQAWKTCNLITTRKIRQQSNLPPQVSRNHHIRKPHLTPLRYSTKAPKFTSSCEGRQYCRFFLAPMSSQAPFKVQHDPKKKCFFIEFENNGINLCFITGRFNWHIRIERAILEYDLNNGVMDMYHTESPNSQRGKGIAAIITEVKATTRFNTLQLIRAVLGCTEVC